MSSNLLGGQKRPLPSTVVMSEIVEVELEELETPSSPLGGDSVPLMGAEQRPMTDSFHEEQSRRNQPRTSIITRQSTSQQQPGYSQHLVEKETVIRETDERTKTTYTSIVQRGPGLDVQLPDQVKQQDPDVPTPKDNLTREKQAELRMLDETEATGEYYTERLDTEQMVLQNVLLAVTTIPTITTITTITIITTITTITTIITVTTITTITTVTTITTFSTITTITAITNLTLSSSSVLPQSPMQLMSTLHCLQEREENTLFFEEIDRDTNQTHSYRIGKRHLVNLISSCATVLCTQFPLRNPVVLLCTQFPLWSPVVLVVTI